MKKRPSRHSRQKRKFIISLVVLAAIAAAIIFWRFAGNNDQKTLPEQRYYSKLTGLEINKEQAERPVLGVMIENHRAARPQSGLSDAGIVFESVTEGGITRYLALYQEDQPEELGPIRSARPHFVEWALGFDASLAHVGGSQPALDMISSKGVKSLNQFNYPGPYYRTDDREAPHNMYAKTSDLASLQVELDHRTPGYQDFHRTNDNPAESPDATSINVGFSSSEFSTSYTYDSGANTYLRQLAGSPDIDDNNNQTIEVKNLIVLQADGNPIDPIGTGKATLFKNGKSQQINWSLDSSGEKLSFTDREGNPAPLNRGKTWIAVLPSSGSLDYS